MSKSPILGPNDKSLFVDPNADQLNLGTLGMSSSPSIGIQSARIAWGVSTDAVVFGHGSDLWNEQDELSKRILPRWAR